MSQQNATNAKPSKADESREVDEEELANLLKAYVSTPAPGPVMGTFDGQPIELTEENIAYMADTAAQAGLWLTVKGSRKQHYMTFAPPEDGFNVVYIAKTPPETPPREPSPAADIAPTKSVETPAQVPGSSNSRHTGSGIRKRSHRCTFCRSTFSTAARLNEHVQKAHANKLASSAGPVSDQAAQI